MTVSYYISGPMRGYQSFNFPAFFECAEYLREALAPERIVHNPAEKDIDEGFDPNLAGGNEKFAHVTDEALHQWMRRDVTDVAASDCIVLLPGWERSEGARRELSVAKWCGLDAYVYHPDEPYGYRLLQRDWETLAEICNEADAEKAAAEAPNPEPDFEEIGRIVYERGREFAEAEGLKTLWGKPIDDDDELLESMHTSTCDSGPNHPGPCDAEVRVTSSTGGQKGQKPERHDLVPIEPTDEVARVYAFGAQKYDDHNWRKGYAWSLSYAALQRHVRAFWAGQSYDPESDLHHLAHAQFHLNTLMEFDFDRGTYGEHDDRVRS